MSILKKVSYYVSLVFLILWGILSFYMGILFFLTMGYEGHAFNVFALSILSLVIVSSGVRKRGHDFRSIVISFVIGLLLAFLALLLGSDILMRFGVLFQLFIPFVVLLFSTFTVLLFLETTIEKKGINKRILIYSLSITCCLVSLMVAPILLAGLLQFLGVFAYMRYLLLLLLLLLLDAVALKSVLFLFKSKSAIEKVAFFLIAAIIFAHLTLHLISLGILINNIVRIYIIGPEIY